jgi:ribonucleoside-diphosphate reductase alpha chain
MNWYNNTTDTFMKRGYLRPNQTIEEKILEMSIHAETILGKPDFRVKMQEYLEKGYYIVPTPVWKNFNPVSTESAISCFGVYIGDSVESILLKAGEVGMQNKIGGGSSGYFGAIRPRGSQIGEEGKSNGSVSMMEIYQTISDIISQPNRRGHFSATQDIEHFDIDEFLRIRSEGHSIQELSFSVSIGDDFMNRLLEADEDCVEKIRKVVKCRFETGFPYIFFKDTVNRNTVDVYKDKGNHISHSNMCHEIMLPNTEDETFVCNLLGMNIEKFDEWKDTDAIEVGIYFMDAMLTDFIDKNKDSFFMKPAVRFAMRHRAMGMGASGYHNYLQSKSIPFSSMEAKFANVDIFKTIKTQAYAASEKMALEYGKPDMLAEDKYTRRHTTLLAVAPNTSSSFIMEQQSQSIEPHVSNYYIKDVAKTRITVKNKYLQKLLEEKEKNTDEVWDDIMKNSGSVQHLDFLSVHEKKVFETFGEISQMEILLQASTRQKFIDQAQSLNLMVPLGSTPSDVTYLIIKAWQLGIKTLYYQLNVSAVQEFGKSITECDSCAG